MKQPKEILTNPGEAFLEAYKILEEACYIPEKYKNIEDFLIKANIPSSKLPTSLRILQFKINLDARIKYSTEEIYKILKLKGLDEYEAKKTSRT